MLAVIMFVAFATTMLFEFVSTTTLDSFAAANTANGLRAHFHHRSGAALAQIMIRAQVDALDPNRESYGNIQLTDQTQFFMGAFGGGREELVGLLGERLAADMEGLGTSVGTFYLDIGTEDGKINANCANGSQQSRNNLRSLVQALVFFDAYNPVFENEDAEGWRRDRAEQVNALLDYIDRDNSRGDTRASEQYGYETLDDDYLPKNNYIDTVDELKLVRGIDDRFWTLFGDQFTIYGDCKINLEAVSDVKTIAAIIFLAAKDPSDPVVANSQQLWRLAKRVGEARGLTASLGLGAGGGFTSLDEFAQLVKEPSGGLESLLASTANAEPQAQADAINAAGQLERVQGVELDSKKLAQIAKVGPRRIYRVEVVSEIGQSSRRLVAIWDTQVQNQNNRDPANATGAWVYWREQ